MRVTLREVRDDDLEVLFQNQADPASGAMAGVAGRDRDGFLAHQARVAADPAVVRRVILLDGGAVAGDIVSWRDADSGDREVGYRIGRQYWGQGIASAAVPLFLAELTERPLYAHVLKPNTRSIRILEKCGFVRLAEDDPHNDDPATYGFVLG
jgi:RimJ/RimL family protein N-acetyltransferase